MGEGEVGGISMKNSDRRPRIGSKWRSKSHGSHGMLYEVIHIANINDIGAYPVSVVYKGTTNSLVWVKTLSNWYEKMEPVKGE